MNVVDIVSEGAVNDGKLVLRAQISHLEVKLPDIRECWAHICEQNGARHLNRVGLSQSRHIDLQVALDPELMDAFTRPAPMDKGRQRDQSIVVVAPHDAVLHCVRADRASIPDIAI